MDLKKINEFEWEISDGDFSGRIIASDELMEKIEGDKSVEQVMNVARLPGILGESLAMPDMHQGYGFSIGGVAAFDLDEGVICPGGVGYDINCSVRLLKTNLVEADLKGKEKEIVKSLSKCVPSGVGVKGSIRLDEKKLNEVLKGGAQWAVEEGYGFENDWRYTENEGKMDSAEVGFVSAKAKGRGMNQLGTLGAGNHFLDVLVVDELFDENVAKVFGLERGQIVVLIHCGSRGLGHQVASDYIRLMGEKYGFSEIDRELVNAPIKSELGRKYFGAMSAAANFAFANKQVITHFVREDLGKFFSDIKMEVIYDVCHNIAKFEKHKGKEILVMRKGATRSFGPGREGVPAEYSGVGQPVFLPGSMGTSSYVLVGTEESEDKSFSSCAHGAGRFLSRSEIKQKLSYDEAVLDMKERGVFVQFGGKKGIIEESPFSYKDIEEVSRVCDEAGLGRKVAKLRPLLVVIG